MLSRPRDGHPSRRRTRRVGVAAALLLTAHAVACGTVLDIREGSSTPAPDAATVDGSAPPTERMDAKAADVVDAEITGPCQVKDGFEDPWDPRSAWPNTLDGTSFDLVEASGRNSQALRLSANAPAESFLSRPIPPSCVPLDVRVSFYPASLTTSIAIARLRLGADVVEIVLGLGGTSSAAVSLKGGTTTASMGYVSFDAWHQLHLRYEEQRITAKVDANTAEVALASQASPQHVELGVMKPQSGGFNPGNGADVAITFDDVAIE